MTALLEEAVRRGASDLHLSPGQRPKLRLDGEIADTSLERTLSPGDTLQLAYSVLTETQRRRFEAEDDLDFAFSVQGLARFRGNVYKQRGCVAMAIRNIPFDIPTVAQLALPPTISGLTDRTSGLVLVTGPTGSGKSTTIAAMIDAINRERRGHILTIEDPIEFVHPHGGCIVNQREVGADTRSFAAALKHALRQDPDVILIGELREVEAISTAVTLAETGHLVLATMHTYSAAESVGRIVDVFPAHQQKQVRAQLAIVLEGVVSQLLLPRVGGGRVSAAEVMVCTPAVRALIREDKAHQLYSLMQAGSKHGMLTMNAALTRLHAQGRVRLEECLKRSPDPAELLRLLGDRAPAA